MTATPVPLPPSNLLACYRDGLLKDVVPFWFPRCVDPEHGGFFTAFDRDGTLIDTDKWGWFQGRNAWMLATLFNTVERRPEWLAWAQGGLAFMDKHGVDTDGRMFFHLTREGQPIRKRRYAFSEMFACMAHAAVARAAGSDRHAARARELFAFFTHYNFTPGLIAPKFTGTRPATGIGLRMATIAMVQELRANLGPDPALDAWSDRCIDEVRRLFVKPELEVVMETVAPNGEVLDHFDGRTLLPGHAIEVAWFILHEGKVRGIADYVRLGCQMLDYMWKRGWDEECGGMYYFRDLKGLPVQEYWHDMKFWWVHNETIIATLLAWSLTGDEKYRRWHAQVHDWTYRFFPDAEHGEWYGYLHRDGRISSRLKGGTWKGFFHIPRMQWYCWKLLEDMAAKPAGTAGSRGT
ncbi:MAG: AGE family epimerase/isomerase [Lentisphaerae bacterium]|nr:AGE family epimerase/isomerase [Lentisphaerota bacterium]